MMGDYIRWCSCGRMILRTCQHKANMCDICEEEHAKTLKERLDIENKENKEEWR